jgi:hypothetical protein
MLPLTTGPAGQSGGAFFGALVYMPLNQAMRECRWSQFT